MMMSTRLCVRVDGDSPRPQLLRPGTFCGDGGFALHAQSLRRSWVKLAGPNDPHTVITPFIFHFSHALVKCPVTLIMHPVAHRAGIDMATEAGRSSQPPNRRPPGRMSGDLSPAAYGAAGGRQSATTRGVAKLSHNKGDFVDICDASKPNTPVGVLTLGELHNQSCKGSSVCFN